MTLVDDLVPKSDGPTPEDDQRQDATVLPLISDAGDRRVVVEWLSGRYDVVSPGDATDVLGSGNVDVCIQDPRGFDRHRDLLANAKRTAEPTILPYLLFRENDTALLDDHARQYVDDVIVTPTTMRELAWRIDTLFRLRELSLELHRTNERLDYFVGAAAHDLRNPLNIAQGHAARLEENEAVEHIVDSLDRMEHLIGSLLAIHRTKQASPNTNEEWIELASLVDQCWTVIPSRQARLLPPEGDEVRVRADQGLLRQLLENLLRNAIDHGGDDVTIRVGTLADPDGIYVADDGPGIPGGKRQAVFEEGFTTNQGNGLGLSIVERVCNEHGWSVRATESFEGGARFDITGVEMEW